jgi:hypothetical protein
MRKVTAILMAVAMSASAIGTFTMSAGATASITPVPLTQLSWSAWNHQAGPVLNVMSASEKRLSTLPKTATAAQWNAALINDISANTAYGTIADSPSNALNIDLRLAAHYGTVADGYGLVCVGSNGTNAGACASWTSNLKLGLHYITVATPLVK